MTGLIERARTRIPSLSGFLHRAVSDPRRLAYDLLPIVATPQARQRVARGLAHLRPKTASFHPCPAATKIHATLSKTGLVTELPPISPEIISEIRDYFLATPCHDPYRPHLGKFSHLAPPSDEVNMGLFETAEILAAPHVLWLFNDPVVLDAMELYLGCKPMIDNISCWWSFGGRPAAKGTQRYHRDLDSFGGAKIFFYLTDVDAESGPHVFMKFSHNDPTLATGVAQIDEAVKAAFGADNEVTLTGKAGMRFIADTFGFHKGLLPVQGNRLMLAAQYTVNRTPHLPAKPLVADLPPGFDPYVNKLLIDPPSYPQKVH